MLKIKDSKLNKFHNKMFKQIAESHGLIIEHDDSIGWSLTTLNESTKMMLDEIEWSTNLFRITNSSKQTAKRIMYIYECPDCGTTIRSLKPLNIVCGDCGVAFDMIKGGR